jgi:hypothetical protein
LASPNPERNEPFRVRSTTDEYQVTILHIPVQVTLVARVITKAEVTQGTRTDSNTTLPGVAFEAAQHKPAAEATTSMVVTFEQVVLHICVPVVPTTIIIGKTIISQCLFQTM